MGEGYSSGFAQGGDSLPEQLSDTRGAPDMGRQHAGATPSELMDNGPAPQLHFDLDQMLDVHQEATGLGHGGPMDARVLHRCPILLQLCVFTSLAPVAGVLSGSC